ncbi:hypothetical protein pEaSNUABM5_00301 [Erwinia phage pEa_SNUABM_5]|uniref:Uncharacterized protein n=1 Tax=Erwinia phage pEa_SNUABM_5 TaxID=2797313 RepID=A0A7T8EPT1_9CAUD|nr:hypothetical protein MPK73_gp301 [Erwinia phage pEa_SNUABM_5]QQO90443.1 hypothetical protein pEaSNUABM5_00301 [Erwinia phage pEa_SNUABM_5]
MFSKIAVVSAYLAIATAASQMALATGVSNLTDLSREIALSQPTYTITSEMDSDCKAHFKGNEQLRKANLVFATSKSTIDSYPAWPLVCSYAVMSDKVAVTDLGRGDRQIDFQRVTDSKPYLSIILQQVTDGEDDTDYQMVMMNNQSLMEYSRQKRVMTLMLDQYKHVVGE